MDKEDDNNNEGGALDKNNFLCSFDTNMTMMALKEKLCRHVLKLCAKEKQQRCFDQTK